MDGGVWVKDGGKSRRIVTQAARRLKSYLWRPKNRFDTFCLQFTHYFYINADESIK
jgi:hypothetical protein